RANLELARGEVARRGAKMRSGISLAVPLLTVALRTVVEIELLARLPLRLGPDVGTRRTRRSRQRGAQRGDQDRNTPGREKGARTKQARGHFFAVSSLARGLSPVKS